MRTASIHTSATPLIRHLLFVLWAAILFAPDCASSQPANDSPLIFAAASTKDALDEVVKSFELIHRAKVRVSYAGSNALANQIVNGAPAAVFLSADEPWMDFVQEKGRVVNTSRRDLIRNELVLIAPVASSVGAITIERGFPLATILGGGRLAVANPEAVPAGKYARAALEHFNVWSAVEAKLARTENVRSALMFVARAEAPLGVVYKTDALAEPRVKIVGTFPRSSHPRIVYPVALVRGRDHETAKKFFDFLRDERAVAIWKKYGFEMAVTSR